MRRLKHLAWILPLLLAIAVVTMAITTRSARVNESDLHASWSRSLQVRSTDFRDRGEIPTDLTCRGRGTAPHIAWSGAPAGARSYALVATDWDAPSPALRLFAVPHWVLYNIPPSVSELPAGATPTQLQQRGVAVGTGIGSTPGYVPPCPPLGRHKYLFRVYALDVDSVQPESGSRSDVLRAIEGHVLAFGELVGVRAAR